MVKIRLAKVGRKKDPFYRIVAIEEGKKNIGKSLEVLGYWYPKKDNKEIDSKKIADWVKKGAQVSPAVQKLIKGK
ncbi:30S ribosomal protein S16 [Candidatus Microgenomates bacterium]|nr:30S ribosomal protein S16 [Candidatus Microgenomates bacterium]